MKKIAKVYMLGIKISIIFGCKKENVFIYVKTTLIIDHAIVDEIVKIWLLHREDF